METDLQVEEEHKPIMGKKGAISARFLTVLIVSVLGAVILFQMLPSLFPLVATALHNLSDTMVAYYTSTVPVPSLATIYGLIDTWFGFAVVGGFLGLIINMAISMFSNIRTKKYGRFRRYRR